MELADALAGALAFEFAAPVFFRVALDLTAVVFFAAVFTAVPVRFEVDGFLAVAVAARLPLRWAMLVWFLSESFLAKRQTTSGRGHFRSQLRQRAWTSVLPFQ